MLNTEQYEYFYDPKHRRSAGFQVAVYDRGTEPMVEDQGFGIEPGTNTIVGLDVTEVKKKTNEKPLRIS